ncbi:MAG: O-antigen ligase family protein, partial [Elusimicrobia bacterium]|nr:O-antigen ligase family protein [Elusimicrobiota bacterium]
MSKSLRPPPEAPWAAGLLTAGLCLVAAGAPLAWTRLVVAEYTLPKLLALCLGLLCAAAGLLLSLRPGRPLFRSRLDLPALACLLALGASAFASQDPLLSLLGQYNNYAYGLWALALYAAAYFLSARAPGPAQRRLILDFALGAALAVSAYAVLQAAGLEPFTLSAELPTGRSVSTIGSPVHLGEYLALLFPLALQRALSAGAGRLLGMLGLPLMSLALWSTVSRGAWLAALAGTAFYWAFSGRPRQSLSGLPRMLAALLLLALLLLPASRIISRSASASDIGRIETWKTAWASFAGSPWLGSGPDTFCEIHRKNRGDAFIRAMGPTAHSGDAHNDLLQVLSTTGLAGGLAYLWLLAALALEAARVMRVPGRQDEAAA